MGLGTRKAFAQGGEACRSDLGGDSRAFPYRCSPSPLSHKDIVAEGLRQLLGEEKYRQDLTVPPGYCTGEPQVGWPSPQGYRAVAGSQRPFLFLPPDFLLCVSSSGAVLPVRTQDPFLPYPPRSCPQGQAASQPTTHDPAQR